MPGSQSGFLVARQADKPDCAVYSRENRKLLYFGGISNIGEDGESLSVDIHYRYENDVSFPGSPTAVVQFSPLAPELDLPASAGLVALTRA